MACAVAVHCGPLQNTIVGSTGSSFVYSKQSARRSIGTSASSPPAFAARLAAPMGRGLSRI